MSQKHLLAIDCGNTQTAIGIYDLNAAEEPNAPDTGLKGHWRMSTVPERTEDELAALFKGFFESDSWSWPPEVAGIVISSGVPLLTSSLKKLAERYFSFEPLVLEPGVKTGISILYDNPREVGSDRIANAVAAYSLYGGPAIVVDFGTGTTLDAINGEGAYLGGTISPGVEISLDSLVRNAAALHSVELTPPDNVIGKNTTNALQSGIVYGFAGQVDGLLERFEKEMGESVVVATGGLAHLIVPYTKSISRTEPWLTLYGLKLVWELNQKPE